MLIKKYVVNNMNEALTKIRYELGKDAVIISQRKVRQSGFMGRFKKKQIEVTAAVENSYVDRNVKASQKKNIVRNEQKDDDSYAKSIDELKKVMNKHLYNQNSEKISSQINVKKTEKVEDSSIQSEVKEMKKMLQNVLNEKDSNEASNELSAFIKKSDIDSNFYDEIKDKANGDYSEENLKKILESDIQISTDQLKGNVVLVGPTGVGKTTTIAKLAGKMALINKKKVGLITVDTYRIGAVEQLKTYAEIMNIPFEVVITIKEMEKAIEKMKDCDIILIDTTGRSSKNKMQISELRAFVQKANPQSVNVVISSTTKNNDIKTILDGYRVLDYDRVIITKLDETTSYGSIYNISKYADKPIRYITTGQNVPDDILDATKDRLLGYIFEEEQIC